MKQIRKRLTFIVIQGQPKELQWLLGQPKHYFAWFLRVFLLNPLFMPLGIPEETFNILEMSEAIAG